MTDETKTCATCGETDGWPVELCLTRFDPAARTAARKNGRCQYSREGQARCAERMKEIAAKIGGSSLKENRDGR